MAAGLLPALGGAQAYWADINSFVTTPEGFILEGSCDQEKGWKKLTDRIEAAKKVG